MALRAIRSATIENHPGPPEPINRLPPRGKQRKLDKFKCDACRSSKQKCLPQGRTWPGQRCQRCIKKHLPCSASTEKKRVRSRRSAVSCSPDGSLPSSIQDPEHITPVVVPVRNNVANSGSLTDLRLVDIYSETNRQGASPLIISTATHSNYTEGGHLELLQERQSQPWMDETMSLVQQMADTVKDHESWLSACHHAFYWVWSHPQSADTLEYLHSMNHYIAKALLEGVFCLAIHNNNVLLVEEMLAAGHNPQPLVDSRRWHGPETGLQIACQRPNPKIVDALLRAGEDPNHFSAPSRDDDDDDDDDDDKEGDEPPLSYLILRSDPGDSNVFAIARILLDKGADINRGEPPPLSAAASIGDLEMVRFLLSRGADAKFSSPKDGSTALSCLLLSLHPRLRHCTISVDIATKIVEVLVGAGTHVGACFPQLLSGYHCYLEMAVSSRYNGNLVQLLLSHGASPCQYALKRALELDNSADIAKILIDSGARVNHDVIEVAAEYSKTELVFFLIDRSDDHSLRWRYRNMAFITALFHGRTSLAEELASRNAQLCGDDKLTTAIERAARSGDKRIIGLLFDKQSPYRQAAIPCMGDSLSMAILAREDEVAETLLEGSLGSDSSASRPTARSLWAALKRGKIILARQLLGAGTPVTLVGETREIGRALEPRGVRSVLPGVVGTKDSSLALELIAAGADLDAPGFDDDKPEPALVAAIECGQRDLIDALIDAGADVNLKGLATKARVRTPLQAAVERGDVALVKQLLGHGTDPEDEGALCEAVSYWHASAGLFTILVDSIQARHQRPWRLFGRCVLQRAILRAIFEKDFTVINSILTCKVDLDSVVHNKSRPSHHIYSATFQESCLGTAIWVDKGQGHPIVDMLLRAGANPNGITIHSFKPQSSMTALMQAIKQKDARLVSLLIQYGATVNANTPISTLLPRSPLQLAVEVGDYEIVKLLLDKSANVDEAAAEYYGATALQLAARKGNLEITGLLLDYGANIIAPPAAVGGSTALEEAAQGGHLSIIRLFLRSGIKIPLDQYRRGATLAKKKGHRLVFHFLESSAREVGV